MIPRRTIVVGIIATILFVCSFLVGNSPATTKGSRRAVVQGIFCASCAEKIKVSLNSMSGIDSTVVKAAPGIVEVFGDAAVLSDSAIGKAIHEAGYKTRRIEPLKLR